MHVISICIVAYYFCYRRNSYCGNNRKAVYYGCFISRIQHFYRIIEMK